MSDKDIHYFEVQVLKWEKSNSQGRPPSVTLMLQSDEAVDYFAQLSIVKGTKANPIAGQILDAAFSLSEQDDQPRPDTSDDKPKGSRLSQDAYLLCQSQVFYRYITKYCEFDRGRDDTNPADLARRFILNYCKINSRAELDHNEDAAMLFREMHHNYSNWVAANNA